MIFFTRGRCTDKNHICKINIKSRYVQTLKFPIFDLNAQEPETLIFSIPTVCLMYLPFRLIMFPLNTSDST